MKILTQEEETEHYHATLLGGAMGGVGGLALGVLGVYGASRRYPAFRNLTLPLQAFLVTSSATFGAIVSADAYSRSYERQRNPEYNYQDEQQSLKAQADAQKTTRQKTMDWLGENRYSIVFGSWVASMGTALGLVGRNPYLTGQQKLVQARVYAQGLTIAVVIISLAFETSDSSKGKGRWETVKVLDPNDPSHKHMIEKQIHHESYAGEDQWRDMVEAEEARIKSRGEHRHTEHDKQDRKAAKEKEKKQQEEQEKQQQSNKKDEGGEKSGGDGKAKQQPAKTKEHQETGVGKGEVEKAKGSS